MFSCRNTTDYYSLADTVSMNYSCINTVKPLRRRKVLHITIGVHCMQEPRQPTSNQQAVIPHTPTVPARQYKPQQLEGAHIRYSDCLCCSV